MRPDKREKIDTLLLRQVSGNLSSTETAALQRFADEHPEVRTLWTKLEDRLNSADAQVFKRNLDAGADWLLVTQRIHENKRRARRRKLRFGVVLTSMAALIVYSSALYIKQYINKSSLPRQGATRTPAKPPVPHYSNTGK
ncbi:hypothetical protein MKQ70_36070 [Chitinophaga sedimenti]|uniref:hypothetical protein n=1 Tax=Chitinophaga sedimenti TaxID=2033606 RepID=UPI0020065FB0|nr:hypothetical protein [Chitinophaga sedimenti]MCK7560051.1 hypothetical protein [Chitinophaga sedimenti]